MIKKRKNVNPGVTNSLVDRKTVSVAALKASPGQAAAPKRGASSVFWTIVIMAFGGFCMFHTWKLGAALVVHLPRVIFNSNNTGSQKGPGPPTCRLRHGHIVAGQELCTIQPYLDRAVQKAVAELKLGLEETIDEPGIKGSPAEDDGDGGTQRAVQDRSLIGRQPLPQPQEGEVAAAQQGEPLWQKAQHEPGRPQDNPKEDPWLAHIHRRNSKQPGTGQKPHADPSARGSMLAGALDPEPRHGARREERNSFKEQHPRVPTAWQERTDTHAERPRHSTQAGPGHVPSGMDRRPGGGLPPRNRMPPRIYDPPGSPADREWAARMSIVVSWVNGSDPEYQSLREEHGGKRMVGTSRDRTVGELLHAFRCIERFMPWHKGTIFLVSPGQTPTWLNTSHPRVKVVDQDTLIPRWATPTFSSNVVEQHLHRIEGLSDAFIYWNDDYFLGRPLQPHDFFRFYPDGTRSMKFFMTPGAIRHGAEKVEEARKGPKKWYATLYHTNGKLNEAFGRNPRRSHIAHAPYMFHKEAMRLVHEKWGKELNETIAHKFRAWDDYLTPYLHHYYVMEEGSRCCNLAFDVRVFYREHLDMFQFHIVTNNHTANAVNFRSIMDHRPKFYTLNDGYKNPMIGERQLWPFLHRINEGYKSTFEL